MEMRKLRFATLGAGFWAQYQLAGWYEVSGVECVAICNRTAAKAESIAQKFAIGRVYTDPLQMLADTKIDFLDIVTDVDSHCAFVKMAAERQIPVVCQKPMASSYETATEMVETCNRASVPFFINENWRWQSPLRELKRVLESGVIGKPFRARLEMISGFPVFQNQPFLRSLEQFILTDLGSHILDVARFLFGEAASLYCRTHQIHSDIRGEDAATVVLEMKSDVTVVVNMAYAGNHVERECFPQTLVFVEGSAGSVEIFPDYEIHVTTSDGTRASRHAPTRYSWADPRYEIVHSSIVPCQKDILHGLLGGKAETTGEDNLKTSRLVFAAYQSAAKNQVVFLES
jgi:predicted dehydrogenase